MPNWCHNTLTVSGKPEDVIRFRNKARGRTHAYNDFDYSPIGEGSWGGFDKIRLLSILETPPELGEAKELSFHRLYPIPDKVMSLPYDHRSAIRLLEHLGLETDDVVTGYNWESAHWGHKWGCSDVCTHHDPNDKYLQYTFETPWSPSIQWLNKVAGDYPELDFDLQFEEPGMAFQGVSSWSNGECIRDEVWELEEEEYSEEE